MRNYKEATQGPTLVDETNIVLVTKKESRVLSEKAEQNPIPFQIQDTNTKGIKAKIGLSQRRIADWIKTPSWTEQHTALGSVMRVGIPLCNACVKAMGSPIYRYSGVCS